MRDRRKRAVTGPCLCRAWHRAFNEAEGGWLARKASSWTFPRRTTTTTTTTTCQDFQGKRHAHHRVSLVPLIRQIQDLKTDRKITSQTREKSFQSIYPAVQPLKMAKRSREDFEPSSPESESTRESTPSAGLVVHPASIPATSNTPKIVHLDRESGEAPPVIEMRCSLPGHRQTLSFTSFEEYDVHYAKTHVNRCVECRKNFPTEHFLNLHIEENHDALVSVKRERGEKTVSYVLFQ